MSNKRIFVIGLILVVIGLMIFFIRYKSVVQVIPSPSSLLPLSSNLTYSKVTHVIDGDTIVIDTGQKVRYIGMNTPEVETNECFNSEATQINKDLVIGKTVTLEKDFSDTDKYGRLLRYVFVDDTFVDDYLVKNGYAKVMAVPPDMKYQDTFLESEKYAKENNLGLWGKCK